MNTFKKSVIAFATIATIAATAVAPAHAGGGKWKKGFGAGLGFGVGLGIAGAIINNAQPRTVYVVQPSCWTQRQAVYNQYGQFAGYQNVQVCS